MFFGLNLCVRVRVRVRVCEVWVKGEKRMCTGRRTLCLCTLYVGVFTAEG